MKEIPLSPAAPGRRYDAVAERKANVIGTRLQRARKERGLSLVLLSERLRSYGVEVSKGAISKWETGETVPSAYQLLAVSAALDLEDRLWQFAESFQPPLNEQGRRKLEEYKADLVASGRYRPAAAYPEIIRYVEMPVSTLRVSAGTGNFLDEDSFERVSFPENQVPEGADFGVRVAGDSMEPVYRDGQIVWVQRCECVRVGEVGVFLYDGAGYLKAYGEQTPEEAFAEDYTDSEGVLRTQPVLISYNRAYAPLPVNPNALFQTIGRVL